MYHDAAAKDKTSGTKTSKIAGQKVEKCSDGLTWPTRAKEKLNGETRWKSANHNRLSLVSTLCSNVFPHSDTICLFLTLESGPPLPFLGSFLRSSSCFSPFLSRWTSWIARKADIQAESRSRQENNEWTRPTNVSRLDEEMDAFVGHPGRNITAIFCLASLAGRTTVTRSLQLGSLRKFEITFSLINIKQVPSTFPYKWYVVCHDTLITVIWLFCVDAVTSAMQVTYRQCDDSHNFIPCTQDYRLPRVINDRHGFTDCVLLFTYGIKRSMKRGINAQLRTNIFSKHRLGPSFRFQ